MVRWSGSQLVFLSWLGMGWDEWIVKLVIIGPRSFKSTFGADKKFGITLNTNAPDLPSNRK